MVAERQQELDLHEIRHEIDTIDQKITQLLCRRMEITKKVAAYKQQKNLPVYHPEREKKVIEQVTHLAGEEYHATIAAIYQCIMDESKKLQESWLEQGGEIKG